MQKRFLTVCLSIILAFASVFGLSACINDKPFTVTFDMNREEARLAAGYEDYKLVQTVSNWKELRIPVFVSENAYHTGWNGIISDIKKDTVLKAVWSEKTFVIEFEPGAADAVLLSGSEKVTTNEPAYISKPVYTRKGYTMDPTWGGFNFEELKSDCKVTAKWIPNDYKIYFAEKDGLELVFPEDSGVLYDADGKPYIDIKYDQIIGELPEPQNDSLLFGAWQMKGDSTKVFSDSVYKNDCDIILEAVWVKDEQYIISYVNVDTTTNPIYYSSADVKDGALPLVNPTREGYEFIGWTYDGVDEPTLNASIEQGATGDKTFTAHWEVKSISIQLDALSGGTVPSSYITVTYGEKVGKLPVPTREGYEFVSWKLANGTEINKDTIWTIDPAQDSKTILTAVYKRIYTIKLVLKCTVRSADVTCSLVPGTYESLGLVKSETEEYTYLLNNVKEDSLLPVLPSARPYDTGEYAFSSWKHTRLVNGKEKKVTVNAGWLVNETQFPGTYDSGVIVINVSCYALWTPYY